MKKVFAIIIILVLIVIIRNIILSITSLTNNNRQLAELKNNLITKKRENQLLKEQLKYVKTDEYVEFEARDKLGLAREDEMVVRIPPPQKQKSILKTAPIEEANYKKWWKLINP